MMTHRFLARSFHAWGEDRMAWYMLLCECWEGLDPINDQKVARGA